MRFKKESYQFERREEIMQFFDEFSHYWTEDKMWSVSEALKPRGTRKKE